MKECSAHSERKKRAEKKGNFSDACSYLTLLSNIFYSCMPLIILLHNDNFINLMSPFTFGAFP